MKNMYNYDRIENYSKQIKDTFKVLSSEEVYNAWADTFEIEDIDEKYVTFVYHGSESVKTFKKVCLKSLEFCARLALGEKQKVKIVQSGQKGIIAPATRKKIRAFVFFVIAMIFVCAALAVSIVLTEYISTREFTETFYSTSSIKVDSNVRVIQISDLHCVSYGTDNEKLLARIEALNPDVIICTGDIVNSAVDNVEFAVSLAEKLSKIAPTYYIYGNNEVETIYDVPLNEKDLDEKFGFTGNNRDQSAMLRVRDSFENSLEKAGIKVLKNEMDTIQVGTMTIDVYGVLNSNPSSFWSYSEDAFLSYIYENPDHLKITAIHEPYIFETFQWDYWGDLMVCGHTHGGLIRVPVLGPLYTYEGGLFPERAGCFVYGRYDVAGAPLIVSSGLDNSSIFRINNEPELVIIDINKF